MFGDSKRQVKCEWETKMKYIYKRFNRNTLPTEMWANSDAYSY